MTDIEVVDIADNTNKEEIKENVKEDIKENVKEEIKEDVKQDIKENVKEEDITSPEGGVIRRVLEHPSSIKENRQEDVEGDIQ